MSLLSSSTIYTIRYAALALSAGDTPTNLSESNIERRSSHQTQTSEGFYGTLQYLSEYERRFFHDYMLIFAVI